MIYLSGIHALNLRCNLNTGGDWHIGALKWEDLTWLESENSVFKNYGIEKGRPLTFIQDKYPDVYNIANHIRACLDLLEMGNLALPQCMRRDFIVTDEYDQEIFEHVIMLKNNVNNKEWIKRKITWNDIDLFMGREYEMKWIRFKKSLN